MKTKYVRCINGFMFIRDAPTTGEILLVTAEEFDCYYLKGYSGAWLKHRYEVIGCPCNVTGCLTHRLVNSSG
jgi:hypothetical protein